MKCFICRSLLAALFVLVSFVGSPAEANPDLKKGLSDLGRAVADFLKKEGGSSINVGDFIAPPRLQASGGAGLRLEIAAALQQHKIDVRPDAPFQLIGRFTVRDEKADKADGFESLALRISASVLDKDDEELGKLNISVFGDAALQIAGGTADLPLDLPPAQRQERAREAIDNPSFSIAENETRCAANSPFGIEVRVRRGLGQDSTPRTPEDDRGRAFVKLSKGEEYIVRLYNRAAYEAAVTLTVDGLSMFAFSQEGNFGSQVLVSPASFVEIPGWYVSNVHSDAFEITSYGKSAAASKGVPVTSSGTITATFHEAVAGSDKDVNATGRGRKIDQEYVEVKRTIKNSEAVVSVRYNR